MLLNLWTVVWVLSALGSGVIFGSALVHQLEARGESKLARVVPPLIGCAMMIGAATLSFFA